MSDCDNKILVVEDDPTFAAGLVNGLTKQGFDVELATDGANGISLALKNKYDLVLLDLNLPGRDGFEVLTAWQTRLSTPIIVLSARTDLDSRLKSFSLGAVDYLPKPFWMEELLARIHSKLKIRAESPHRIISWDNAALDLDARSVSLNENTVEFTFHEFNILSFLVERPGRAITRRQLADEALPEDGDRYDRTVDSHVSRIRNKLGSLASERIKTIRGVGYRFDPPGSSQ